MAKIYVTKAERLKRYLSIIDDWEVKKNVSYHLQYIEFLYKIKKEHDPKYTTLSLLNKTIIVEYFTVIEAIVDNLLCQLHVMIDEDSYVSIEISEYTRAEELLRLAKRYHVINTAIHSQLGQIKNIRNRIHIKRLRKNQKSEHEEYTQKRLQENQKMFKDFMIFLSYKYQVDYTDYPWPWKI